MSQEQAPALKSASMIAVEIADASGWGKRTLNYERIRQAARAGYNRGFAARTPDPAVAGLVEALEIAVACGSPSRVALYDEEAVDGWEWQHPDGREWSEIGDHNDPPPAHPIISEALATWGAQ